MHQDPRLIFDCHLDLAWNALGYRRDLTLPLERLNQTERGLTDEPGRGRATTTLPEMRAGGVGLCMATLIARTPVGATAIHGGLLDYPTPAAAGAVATGQLAWYRALEEAGEVMLLATGGELQAHARRWRAGEERRVGIVLAMEGSDRSSLRITLHAGTPPGCEWPAWCTTGWDATLVAPAPMVS